MFAGKISAVIVAVSMLVVFSACACLPPSPPDPFTKDQINNYINGNNESVVTNCTALAQDHIALEKGYAQAVSDDITGSKPTSQNLTVIVVPVTGINFEVGSFQMATA